MADYDWDRCPDDALLRIFHYVPLLDRIQLELVCKRWKTLLRESWTDVSSLVVWRNEIYEDDCDDDPMYISNGGTGTIQCLLKKAGGNLRSLRFVDTSLVDDVVVNTIAQSCRNLEELELHKVLFPEEATQDSVPIVESLLTLPRLSTVAWNQNLGYDDANQQQQIRRVNAGVYLTSFPPMNGADAFTVMRGLRRVHLEDCPLLWGNFVFVCVQLGPTLEEFCYKIWDHFLVPLRCTLMRGLQHLTNLRQLNIGGERKKFRPMGGLVDDEFAIFIACTMPRLERVSMKAADRLTSKGVKALIQNLPRLQYLNLNQCDSVNNSTLESACETRAKNGRYLTVYAAETDVKLEKLNMKNDHVTVLTNPRFIDESVFYGENVVPED